MDVIAATLGASAITWSATAAGAALVFVLPRLPRLGMGVLLTFAGALMAWAAVAGLLLPAWDHAIAQGSSGIMAAVGMVAAVAAGAWAVRRIRQRLSAVADHQPVLGRQLFLVMTLHHVPEGMAVGLAVAAAAQHGADPLAAAGAGALVLAMAVHNAAEGALVSLPLRQEGMSRGRAWIQGQLSGVAEVAGALLGAAAIGMSAAILPWALAAAAGAMLHVVLGDLLPEVRALWARRSDAAATSSPAPVSSAA